jgi:uncharacterized delta-60 repeat protein
MKRLFWLWSFIFVICLGFGIWFLGFGLGGCGHPISQEYPKITSVFPADKSIGADPAAPVKATFDQPMDPSTINAANFTLSSPNGSVPGVISYNASSQQAVFSLIAPLLLSTVYTASISGSVKSSIGEAMNASFSWSFTTASSYPPVVGTPDASFSDGSNIGSVIYSKTSWGEQVKLDKNGKIVVCGNAQDNIAVWRYLSDGTPDPSFGTNGIVTGDAGVAHAFDFDPQGNIVVAAQVGAAGLVLIKFDTLGNLDTGFVNQKTSLISRAIPRSEIIDSNGNIYVAGYGYDVNFTKENGYVWKFKSDGSLDSNFHDGINIGFIQTNKDTDPAGDAEKVLFDGSGKLLVAGSSVWKFNPDTGSPDPSFVTSGLADGAWQSAAIDSAGNIYVAGVSGIRKFDEWGTLKAKAIFSYNYDFPIGQNFNDIAVDAAGKLVIAGSIDNNLKGKDMTIWRRDDSLNLDPSFGDKGMVQPGNGTDSEQIARSLVLDSLGKIVAVGKSPTTIVIFSNDHMAIWRYE